MLVYNKNRVNIHPFFKRGASQETEKLMPRRQSSMGMRTDTLSMLPEYEDSEVSSSDLPRVIKCYIYKYLFSCIELRIFISIKGYL